MPRKRKQATDAAEFITLTYRTRDVDALTIGLLAEIGAVTEFPTPGRETCDVGGPAHVHETLAGNGCHPVERGGGVEI